MNRYLNRFPALMTAALALALSLSAACSDSPNITSVNFNVAGIVGYNDADEGNNRQVYGQVQVDSDGNVSGSLTVTEDVSAPTSTIDLTGGTYDLSGTVAGDRAVIDVVGNDMWIVATVDSGGNLRGTFGTDDPDVAAIEGLLVGVPEVAGDRQVFCGVFDGGTDGIGVLVVDADSQITGAYGVNAPYPMFGLVTGDVDADNAVNIAWNVLSGDSDFSSGDGEGTLDTVDGTMYGSWSEDGGSEYTGNWYGTLSGDGCATSVPE